MDRNLKMFLGLVAVAGIVYFVAKKYNKKKEEKTSNAMGENCNKKMSNKPCWDWVIHKGRVLRT